MKAPISWLKDYVDIDVTPEELAEKLLKVGFEVEEIIYLGENIENVVVGKIEKITKHPDSDHLQICMLNVGDKNDGLLQIVTGAQNVKEGDFVPVALHNSLLPTGTRIKKGKLRGVESFGMLCSGGELKINDSVYEGAEVDGILILKDDVKVGQDIREVIGLDEYVLDIGILANRPDCQSIIGIAREIAAVLGKEIKYPDLSFKEDSKKVNDFVKASVKNGELCPRYILSAVYDVKIQKSPKWIRDRLRWVGINSINNIVDITNFVLTEYGQPMHAFNGALIGGKEIQVRRAKENETIEVLDGTKCKLDNDVLVICDSKNPVALAGIMGGKNSCIDDATNSIVFESAKFLRENIRHSSRKLNVRSDSSYMFERGVDASTSLTGMKRALNLISTLKCGKIASGMIDILAEKIEQKVLEVDTKKIDKLLGISIPKAKMVEILNNLTIKTTLKGDILKCEIPSYRQDIFGYPDIAEEIIRVYGYDNIESTLLEKATVINGGLNTEQKNVALLKRTLASQGFNEVVTYSFVGSKAYENLGLEVDAPVKLLNPLGEEMSIMRTNLVHNILNVCALNMNRKLNDGRLYEFAKVYLKGNNKDNLPDEKDVLSMCAFGEKETFFTLKSCVQTIFNELNVEFEVEKDDICYMHPFKTAKILVDGKKVGYFGEVHPDTLEKYGVNKSVYFAEIYYYMISDLVSPAKDFVAIPKYPNTTRDLALIVNDEISCGDIMNTIKEVGPRTLEEVKLFDIYKGKQIDQDKKSLAFSLSFRAQDRTLQDKEIDKAIDRILKTLKEKFDAVLR